MAENFRRPISAAGSGEHSSFAAAAQHFRTQLLIFSKDTRGATAVEYGLLAGLVAIGLAGGLGALADLVSLLFEVIGDEAADVSNAMSGE